MTPGVLSSHSVTTPEGRVLLPRPLCRRVLVGHLAEARGLLVLRVLIEPVLLREEEVPVRGVLPVLFDRVALIAVDHVHLRSSVGSRYEEHFIGDKNPCQVIPGRFLKLRGSTHEVGVSTQTERLFDVRVFDPLTESIERLFDVRVFDSSSTGLWTTRLTLWITYPQAPVDKFSQRKATFTKANDTQPSRNRTRSNHSSRSPASIQRTGPGLSVKSDHPKQYAKKPPP